MKTYQSHKRVRAAKIERMKDRGRDGSLTIGVEPGIWITLPPDMMVRFIPEIGDYLVEYEDGYRSLSPKGAFEGGYTEVPPETRHQVARRHLGRYHEPLSPCDTEG